MISDRGRQFMSNEFQQFLKANGIRHKVGAPYHPATNGQAERYVRTFKDKFKALKCKPTEVSKELYKLLFTYRRTVHSATEESPAARMFNRPMKSRLDLLLESTNKISSRPLRSFNIGDRVGAREYLYENKWQFGIITKKYGFLHYDILLDDGRSWRRHIDQIIRVGESQAKPIKDKPKARAIKPSITLNVNHNPSQAESASAAPQSTADKQAASPSASPVATEPPILSPRPIRNRRLTNRLTYNRLGEQTIDENNINILHENEPEDIHFS